MPNVFITNAGENAFRVAPDLIAAQQIVGDGRVWHIHHIEEEPEEPETKEEKIFILKGKEMDHHAG